MHGARAIDLILCGLAFAALACGSSAGLSPVASATAESAAAENVTPSQETNADGVRACRYDPEAPEPAATVSGPASTPTPLPTSTPPGQSAVDSQVRARQLDVFDGVWNAVNDHYVDPNFNGRNWAEIGESVQARIEAGLSDTAFYALLQEMVNALGDQHSYFQSPAAVAEDERQTAGQMNFVGIGMLALPTSENTAVVISVIPGSPAAEAGLLPHDSILAVDGGPVRYENGVSRTRGPVGTTVQLTVRTPGETSREMTMTRRQVTGTLPVDFCLVPGSRLAYVMLPTFLDETMDDQLREALAAVTADGPLDGLILDLRMNGGGLGSTAQATLELFLNGPQGAFVTRTTREPFTLDAEDIGGSQTVPLVVLIGPNTVSYAEVASGILQTAGRATVVGQATLGNVEQLRRYDFEDGSRAWIASATFEPVGLPAGIWEDTGIIPEVFVAGSWDEYREANDPGLAAAVEILRTP